MCVCVCLFVDDEEEAERARRGRKRYVTWPSSVSVTKGWYLTIQKQRVSCIVYGVLGVLGRLERRTRRARGCKYAVTGVQRWSRGRRRGSESTTSTLNKAVVRETVTTTTNAGDGHGDGDGNTMRCDGDVLVACHRVMDLNCPEGRRPHTQMGHHHQHLTLY